MMDGRAWNQEPSGTILCISAVRHGSTCPGDPEDLIIYPISVFSQEIQRARWGHYRRRSGLALQSSVCACQLAPRRAQYLRPKAIIKTLDQEKVKMEKFDIPFTAWPVFGGRPSSRLEAMPWFAKVCEGPRSSLFQPVVSCWLAMACSSTR